MTSLWILVQTLVALNQANQSDSTYGMCDDRRITIKGIIPPEDIRHNIIGDPLPNLYKSKELSHNKHILDPVG